jgi:mannosyltransferase OCH1-like enzyme
MIPKIIHQTWKSDVLPNILDNIYKHNLKIHEGTDITFKLWSHTPGNPDIDNFLKENYNDLYNVFIKTKIGVQKGDIARLAILYHYGGIYIDLDILCLKSIDNLVDFTSDKLYMCNEPSEQTIKVFNNDNYLCNAFVATPPNHPILKTAIDGIIKIYNSYGDMIFNKFDIFGGNFMQNIVSHIINKNIFELINTNLIFPINDPKFNDLPSSKKDWNRLKNGYYGSEAILVHYWLHGDFESKYLIDNFKCDDNLSIHDNIYQFFCKLYPSNILN